MTKTAATKSREATLALAGLDLGYDFYTAPEAPISKQE